MSDRDLVDAIITENDDNAIFCLFYHKFIKLFTYLSDTYSKLRLSPEDIACEMYIFLSKNNWEKLRSFEFKSSLFGWIKTVAKRYLLNRIRKTLPYIKDEIFFITVIEHGEEGEYDPTVNIPDPNRIFMEEIRDDLDFIREFHKKRVA
jgi:DNA-directed RNA polymerase specialized sigma24 family protein